MKTNLIINPVSRRPLLAMPFILLGTLGLLYFGAIAPEGLLIQLPFRLGVTPFVDARY